MTATGFLRIEALIDVMAAERPDRPAFIFGDRCWSYAALRTEMDRRAAVLVTAGLQPGEIVTTAEPPGDDLAITFLACCRADLALFLLSPALTMVEITALLAQGHPQAILTAHGEPHPASPTVPALPLALPGTASAAAAREAARRSSAGSPEAIAAILVTSGSTGGRSKLICWPHRQHTWRYGNPEWWEAADGINYTPQRNLFVPGDVCDVLLVGGTMIFSHATAPEQIEAEMVAYQVTILSTGPARLRLLAGQTPPPPTGLALRVIWTVGAPLPPVIARAGEDRYGATVLQQYGSTEGGMLIGAPQEGVPEGSIGRPYAGVEARIVAEDGTAAPDGAIGELIVRSPGLMHGYLDDPEATAHALRDGWLWTGDLAYRDAAGFYFLVGRRALRINVAGNKVAPEEVEAVLEAHPAVCEAAVMASADAARGEVVRAVIVAQGARPAVGELRRWCRERLAGYKVPRVWEFREELPRSPLGKVLRHLL